jgi:hypothetical protein
MVVVLSDLELTLVPLLLLGPVLFALAFHSEKPLFICRSPPKAVAGVASSLGAMPARRA